MIFEKDLDYYFESYVMYFLNETLYEFITTLHRASGHDDRDYRTYFVSKDFDL